MGQRVFCMFAQMLDMEDWFDFLDPLNVLGLNDDNGYNDGQLARHIHTNEGEMPELEGVDIILVGAGETRGSGRYEARMDGPDAIRKQIYQLHYWHQDLAIADVGNIKAGQSLSDSYAAIKTVLGELMKTGARIVILGGSHDVTLAQYFAYRDAHQLIDATCVDATIDLRGESSIRSENFLLEMLTSEPNVVKHYNHIAFQSYFVHPRMLETMDKLRFDPYRVGRVKEDLEDIEPAIRSSHLISFDISAIKYGDSPASECSPNGLTGEEACIITRFAGMSTNNSTIGFYGYHPHADVNELSAKQIAQMFWYFMDGVSRSREESDLKERAHFNEFNTVFVDVDTVFLQSRTTGRWWMQMPDQKFIPCTYRDYLAAAKGEIPERWLRTQERL